MSQLCVLSDLDVGRCCIVLNVLNEGIMRRRLMDIGIIPGSEICCVLNSPSGNPKCYLINNSMIALRNSDASLIEVKLL